MPELSRFFGIVIYMYFDDHTPPHFHAKHNEDNVVIGIESLDVLEGSIGARELRLIRKWARDHKEELLEAWALSSNFENPDRIEPLH